MYPNYLKIKNWSKVVAITIVFIFTGLILKAQTTTSGTTSVPDSTAAASAPDSTSADSTPVRGRLASSNASLVVTPLVSGVNDCTSFATVPTTTQNYIMTYIPRAKGYIPGSANTTCTLMEVIQYFDGLGRLSQTVQVKGSTAGNDVVQPVVYDEFDREVTKYLPYALQSGTSDGSFKTSPITAQTSFYTSPPTGVSIIGKPLAGTAFEPSPLNRVIEQGAPGDSWQLTGTPNSSGLLSGHTKKAVYADNDGTTYWAREYGVAIDGSGNRTLIFQNTYAAGQLLVTVTKNENWTTSQTDSRLNTTEEYKDKDGRIILKRTYNYTSAVQVLSTYYVYDNLGNLCFVLTPASNADSSSGITSAANQTTLDNLCYQYQYDLRNRVVQKKLPGKGWEYLAYNTLDQVVATQDANQRSVSPEQWTFTKYDGQGRVIITGLYLYGATAGTNYLSTIVSSIAGVATLWETPVTTGNGYTSAAWPTSWTGATLGINYYDNYSMPGKPSGYTGPSGNLVNPIGLPTATQTNVLGTSNMLWSVNYYDGLGRNIETYQQHYLGGAINVANYDQVISTYNFNNQVTTIIRKHYNTANVVPNPPLLTINNKLIYDHIGRKIKSWEQITNLGNTATTSTLLSQITYNEIGQVYNKQLHCTDTTVATPVFLQNIIYAYNERGWLSKINNPLTAPTTAQMFSEQLQYDQVSNITGITPTAQYNGNIASQTWYSYSATTNKSYTYLYDNLNRLKSGVSTDNNNESGIVYDLMGNITALNRYKAGTLMDQMAYNYTSAGNATNQLQSVLENSNSALTGGMVNGTMSYTYDANGNMLTNANTATLIQNKTFTYNLLNLPQTVVTNAGGTDTYTYTANGQKLRKVNVKGGVTTTTDYINGIQYNNSTTAIGFIQTEEGKVTTTGGTNIDYYYYLGDNLDNTRVMFDTQGGTANKLQVDDYYPFGLEINRSVASPKNEYLYNNKELQEELVQYDYGARFYDPIIGRWTTIDPLSEKNRRWSTYDYVSDNPISRIDPDGMDDYTMNKDGDINKASDTKEKTDRIVKTDKDGKILKKGEGFLGFLVSKEHRGEAKTAIGGIEKGILKTGQNFQNKDQVISVGGNGQPSVAGVKSFTLQLSEYVGKEIKGFSYSSDASGNVTDVVLGKYINNELMKSFGSVGELLKKYGDNFSTNNILQEFHTHPDGKLGATESAPELSQDVTSLHNDKPQMPNASFIILYRVPGRTAPAEYDYTRN